MMLYGVYPFNVKIRNTFHINSGINFTIRHYQRRLYVDAESQDIIIENTALEDDQPPCAEYTLQPGYCISLPLSFGNERLEVQYQEDENSANNSQVKESIKNYCVVVGARAKAQMSDITETSGLAHFPLIPEKPIRKCEEDPGWYKGGIWAFDNRINNPDQANGSDIVYSTETKWKLTIKKYTFDPEEDEVAIGPTTPN